MHTTCPSCKTVFRVTAEQLEVHAGKVRCGKCAFVFNAFDTLTTPIETVSLIPPPDELPPPEEHITLEPAPPTMAEPLAVSFPIPTDEQIERETEEINRTIAALEQQKRPSRQRSEAGEEERPAGGRLAVTPELQEKLQNLQEELRQQERRARLRRLGWGLASLLLLLTAVGQVAYFQRDWLATHHPGLRPLLVAFCARLGCEVRLPAQAERIRLEASELQADAARPHGVILSAVLRNTAPWPQAWPYLELTLTDAADRPLARRHFTPQEYLAGSSAVRLVTGMPPEEEVQIRLSLELKGIEPVGYKLLVYYP
jgi:predicted Zn finger-like uncharacterized protein